jgi:hypothetical protein
MYSKNTGSFVVFVRDDDEIIIYCESGTFRLCLFSEIHFLKNNFLNFSVFVCY